MSTDQTSRFVADALPGLPYLSKESQKRRILGGPEVVMGL